MFIVGIFLGIVIGMFIIALLSVDTIKQYDNERYNAENRALIHFRKLQAIERILEKAKETKEPAVFVVDKIKEVIVGQNK